MPKSYHPRAACVNAVYLGAKDANLRLASFIFISLLTLIRVKMAYHEANTMEMCSVLTLRLKCLDERLTVPN